MIFRDKNKIIAFFQKFNFNAVAIKSLLDYKLII